MKEMNFEQSFERLEKILQQMNDGQLSLDRSLSLYEEADKLIGACQKHLSNAEKKIECLKKNRAGDIEVTDEGEPKVTSFETP